MSLAWNSCGSSASGTKRSSITTRSRTAAGSSAEQAAQRVDLLAGDHQPQTRIGNLRDRVQQFGTTLVAPQAAEQQQHAPRRAQPQRCATDWRPDGPVGNRG